MPFTFEIPVLAKFTFLLSAVLVNFCIIQYTPTKTFVLWFCAVDAIMTMHRLNVLHKLCHSHYLLYKKISESSWLYTTVVQHVRHYYSLSEWLHNNLCFAKWLTMNGDLYREWVMFPFYNTLISKYDFKILYFTGQFTTVKSSPAPADFYYEINYKNLRSAGNRFLKTRHETRQYIVICLCTNTKINCLW